MLPFEFLGEVLVSWKSILGVAALLLFLYNEYAPKKVPVPQWLTAFVGAAFLLYSSFSAWEIERLARVEAEDQLKRLTVPQMSLEMDQILISNVLHRDVVIPRVVVLASITNIGAASICDDWLLTVERLEPMPYRTTEMPWWVDGTTITIDETSAVKLRSSEQLFSKVLPAPLPTGARQRGFIEFRFENRNIGDIRGDIGAKSGRVDEVYLNKFTLSCMDVTGQLVSVTRPLGGEDVATPPQMWPGLDYEEGTVNDRQEFIPRP